MGIQICSNQGVGPFRGKKGESLTNHKKNKILLMNHWPECIDIWHGTS